MTHIEKQVVKTVTRVLRLRKLHPKSEQLKKRMFWINFHFNELVNSMCELDKELDRLQADEEFMP